MLILQSSTNSSPRVFKSLQARVIAKREAALAEHGRFVEQQDVFIPSLPKAGLLRATVFRFLDRIRARWTTYTEQRAQKKHALRLAERLWKSHPEHLYRKIEIKNDRGRVIANGQLFSSVPGRRRCMYLLLNTISEPYNYRQFRIEMPRFNPFAQRPRIKVESMGPSLLFRTLDYLTGRGPLKSKFSTKNSWAAFNTALVNALPGIQAANNKYYNFRLPKVADLVSTLQNPPLDPNVLGNELFL